MEIKLRGHHLLCIKGFQGYGYDENFTENMKKINIKRKLPSTKIKLTNETDDICSSCPNLKDEICKNENQNRNIIRMDNQVLKNFNIDQTYNSIELFDNIDKIFNTKEKVSEICFNCMWNEKCLFYQKLSENR